MGDVRISVCIPTTGRPTLQRAIDSAEGAYEVLVDHNSDGDYGYAARNRLIAKAKGTHIAYVDDDDVFAPGALEIMESSACDRPVIHRMQYAGGTILWQHKALLYGNVGTPMFLVPNIPRKMGQWRDYLDSGTGGDFVYIQSCCAKMGDPVWDERIVALVRPVDPVLVEA